MSGATVLLAAIALGLVLTNGADAAAGRRPVSGSNASSASLGADTAARRARLSRVRTWGYQLRIRDLAPLVTSATDMLVIDHGYAARRLDKTTFAAADIASLKTAAGGQRRIVLSYLSIGEAEQYRYYWQGPWCLRATAPKWLGKVNPNWPGNYPVRFWDPAWQRLILDPVDGYLAKIQAQGFDGIYLDRADVYGEWAAENAHAEADMIVFLGRIATAARARNRNFLIVMQNAEELLAHPRVRQALDGVAKEDLLHGLKFTEDPNSPAEVANSVADLARARAGKLPVFAVEYLADPAAKAAARQRLLALGYVPTFAPRLLDALPPELAGQDAQPTADLPAAASPAGPPGPAWAEGGPTCLTD